MTAKLECVRLTENGYQACFDGKQYTYSFGKYGEVAEEIANESLKQRKRLANLIYVNGNEASMYIWSNKTKQRHIILLDTEDVEKVQLVKWFIEVPQNARTLYAASDKFGKLHRYIMSVSNPKDVIDHKNRNGLDNRKENLRVVDTSINKRNSAIYSNNTSGYKGIYFEGTSVKAAWMENGRLHCKRFSTNIHENALELALEYRRMKEQELGYVS